MSTVRSRITKGRQFQKKIMELFKDAFNLDEENIRTPVGAESGEDVKLSKKARQKIGLSIECKLQKKFNIWEALRQSMANCPSGACEAVVFKEHQKQTIYICVPLDHYLDLRKDLLELVED